MAEFAVPMTKEIKLSD